MQETSLFGEWREENTAPALGLVKSQGVCVTQDPYELGAVFQTPLRLCKLSRCLCTIGRAPNVSQGQHPGLRETSFRIIPILTSYGTVKARRAFSPTKTWVFTHEMASNPTASPSLALPTSLNINLEKITCLIHNKNNIHAK